MKLTLYLNDYETEKLFSYLRWLFVLLSVILFYVPPFSENVATNKDVFPYLLASGCLYMLITQIALFRMKDDKKHLKMVLKLGIAFDYIALIWLMALSGGIHSPLYPISILFVLHATIYWRTRGAFISMLMFSGAYIIMGYFMVDLAQFENYYPAALNLFFLSIIGLFGALIMLRERTHYIQKEAYHDLVHRDYLSGLFNHRSFQEKLKQNCTSGKRFCLLLGDIDDFKKVNDEQGHQKGDEVIKAAGEIFESICDRYNGQAFRYGGEEFALMFPEKTIPEMKGLMDELFATFAKTTILPLSMSFGESCSDEGNVPEELLSLADQRLYKAKQAGKKRVCLRNGELFEGVTESPTPYLVSN
ncbi:GGDEF domain-containing protein [Rossellomorea aquimaris]|uniref:GGDEF domain-containing protein n=1 Tax=Rossellomorea aquimaris TaxID=189382 RepID=UPI001CD3A92D|nr:GGDEF domain-containing protein [Rossellomorea aquimaris]MCA1056679.1 GGDEF domain-containing protein [Rossellomorea aquimaris]